MPSLFDSVRPLLRVVALVTVLLSLAAGTRAQTPTPPCPSHEAPSLVAFLQSLTPADELGAPAPTEEGLGTPAPTLKSVYCGRVPRLCNPNEICVPCGGADAFCAPPGTTCCNGALCYSPHQCVVSSWGASCI
jgi:hypothetical protein